jgi:adenylate cyclase
MAAFGAPYPREDHALGAVYAAVTMRSRLAELSAAGLPGAPIEMRIGVNTGRVVAGRVREGEAASRAGGSARRGGHLHVRGICGR